jgi:hypothetical protein
MASGLKKIEKYIHKGRGKCGTMCKLSERLSYLLDEHPPIKKRVEKVLKDKETWEAAQSRSYTKLLKHFIKAFRISKEDLKNKGVDLNRPQKRIL